MGVSPRTMHAAFEILKHRQVILPAERTKPHLIHPDIANYQGEVHKRESLLILTGKDLQFEQMASRIILDKVAVLYIRKGWTVNFETSPEFAKGKPGPVMKRMLANRSDHLWILNKPSFSIIKWCMDHKLRIICLGGEHEHLLPPLVAISLTQMIRDSVSHLAKLGHRRICSLVHFSSQKSRKNVINKLEQDMHDLGLHFHPNYNLPMFQGNAKSLWKELHNLFAISPPSALIVTDAYQLSTIYSYCLQNGLRIPDDLSLIVTQESANLEWFQPSLAHYQYPIPKYVRRIRGWIENYPTSALKPVLLPPDFKPGDSVSPFR